MKILLLGNYSLLKSTSMDRFESVLGNGLKTAGHQVRLLKPTPALGRLKPSANGIGKWLGYIDRFVLFLPILHRTLKWADVIHVCDQANAVYIPLLGEKPHIVTCHDMLAIRKAAGEFPPFAASITGKVYQKWILFGLKRAQQIVCVSQKTYDDVLQLTKAAPHQISIVPNGLNYPYQRMDEKTSSRYLKQLGLSNCRPFFLHVGNNNWYKNREGLLNIFLHLLDIEKSQQPKLILAGKAMDGKQKSQAKKTGAYKHLREIGEVSSEQLCALYSAAEGLIFPSFGEGFGWPIIEAQACGCPVFTSNRRPMTEIGGSGAIYFDPLDEISAAKMIFQAISDKHKLKKEGYRNVSNFSISRMLLNYISYYQKAVKNRTVRSPRF